MGPPEREYRVFTIGYEGKDATALVALLEEKGIKRVLDVRWLPNARGKPAFSKKNLEQALNARDIEYVHLRALGAPPEIRTQYRATGDAAHFELEYGAYAATQRESLRALVSLATDEPSVLLCREADWRECHRKVLAALLEGHGFKVVHL